MNTTEVTFTLAPYEEAVADALMAALGDLGYDGFTYTDDGFAAYIPAARFDAGQLERSEALAYFANQYAIRWTVREIEDRDWNKEWEDHFTPIVVDNRIQVRAGFHEPLPGMEYEIIIEPKMSFGTGHHATTALMLETILDLEPSLRGKRVRQPERHRERHGPLPRKPRTRQRGGPCAGKNRRMREAGALDLQRARPFLLSHAPGA